MEKLSRACVRLKTSSIVGARKNGWPNRKVGPNPMAVSAGTFEVVAARGRSSLEKLKCPSFTFLLETLVNRLKFTALILDGPSVPFAEVPYVGTSKVWLGLFERSKL